MTSTADHDVTQLLHALGAGDEEAMSELFTAVYQELRRLAHGQRLGWRGQDTLNTTALVHEAYMRLAAAEGAEWQNRGHFFAVACKAMRRILINRARDAATQKRGGDAKRAGITGADTPRVDPEANEELLALDAALTRLEQLDPRQGRVVECRFFGGLGIAETAETLGVSTATVKRDWLAARAWLYRELKPVGRSSPADSSPAT